jgi:hypothetical protein
MREHTVDQKVSVLVKAQSENARSNAYQTRGGVSYPRDEKGHEPEENNRSNTGWSGKVSVENNAK